jgi:hypothetical protein
MPAGRPASIRTRVLTRKISPAEAAILAHAGQGDISAGFRNLINWYWQSINDSDSRVMGQAPLNNPLRDSG